MRRFYPPYEVVRSAAYRAVVPPTGMTSRWVMCEPEPSTMNVPKYSPRDVRNSTCTFVPPAAARVVVIDVMRIVGSRNCASPSGVDAPPSVPYAVASSPCATASRNLRTSASAGDDCAATAAAAGATVGAGVRGGACVGVEVGAGVAAFATVGGAVGVGVALGVCVRAGVTVGDGFAVPECVAVGFAVAVGVADGVELRCGVGVSCATDAIGVGVCITTSGVLLFAGEGTCRAANAERSAPIPKPAMMTPAKSGTIGNPPRSSSSLEGRRRRGPDPELMFSQRSTREGLALDGPTHRKANRQAA